ncbi:conserved hypothetical protein [Vibrio chagasii]|uniref:hypothetical protein n=1 Tax=unclassified Vibrio TaxID=2614977 RepID=UPI0033843AFC|nr:hypothetical protein VCHA50P424_140036 [Vibrio chagasii]CAH7147950.1 hypothetical protein VCHA50O407_230035 [Vibrio chagasii]CAH7271290.1 conserved hypothetical protein [Vibrio chagasii]
MFRAARSGNGTQTLQHYADELDAAIARSLAIFAGIGQYRVKRDGTSFCAPNDGCQKTKLVHLQ